MTFASEGGGHSPVDDLPGSASLDGVVDVDEHDRILRPLVGTFPSPEEAHTIRLRTSVGAAIAAIAPRVTFFIHGGCYGSGIELPAFASRASLLAQGLSLEHGYPIAIPDEPPADPELTKIGVKLIGRNGGLSCNQCHAINRSPALVPFDSPAPNFMYVTERLRKDYYHRWTRNPQVLQPGTKMPTFADAEGKTAFKDILGGDASAQFEAIWQYLRAGRNIVPPE